MITYIAILVGLQFTDAAFREHLRSLPIPQPPASQVESRAPVADVARPPSPSVPDSTAGIIVPSVEAEPTRVETVPEPIPDDSIPAEARPKPTIAFSVSASAAVAEKLPRGLMFGAPWCDPCKRVKRENPDLIGEDSSYPIQYIDTTVTDYYREFDLAPSAILNLPTFVVLDQTGKLHYVEVKDGRPLCQKIGYQTTDELRVWMAEPTHGITPERAETKPDSVATVSGVDPSAEAVAAALAMHLATQANAEIPVGFGDLFSMDYDIDDRLLDTARTFLVTKHVEFPSSGISVDWAGTEPALKLLEGGMVFSPGPVVRLEKWGVSVSTTITGVEYPSDLSSVTIRMKKAPSFTVRFR